MKYQVTQQETVLEGLVKLSPNSSKATFKKWIAEERVFLNGAPLRKLVGTLQEGDVLSIGSKPKFIEEGIKILFEDEHLIAIDKPAGLLSVATNFEKGDTAHGCLKRYLRPNQVHVVHRLDQDTSGVMLFALSEEARDALKKLFEAHDLKREYIAIVEGRPEPAKGTWTSYLYEDAQYKVHTTTNPELGQKAITHYELQGTSKRFAKLKLTLETGKKNQIRVHCQQAGIPVIGDKKYGSTCNPLKRLGLHSHLLQFKHPITGKNLTFHVPEPENFTRMMKQRKPT